MADRLLKIVQLENAMLKEQITVAREENEQLKRSLKTYQTQLEGYRKMLTEFSTMDSAAKSNGDPPAGQPPGSQRAASGSSVNEEELSTIRVQLADSKQELLKARETEKGYIEKIKELEVKLKISEDLHRDEVSALSEKYEKAREEGLMSRAMTEMVKTSQKKVENLQEELDTLKRSGVISPPGSMESAGPTNSEQNLTKALETLAALPLPDDMDGESVASTDVVDVVPQMPTNVFRKLNGSGYGGVRKNSTLSERKRRSTTKSADTLSRFSVSSNRSISSSRSNPNTPEKGGLQMPRRPVSRSRSASNLASATDLKSSTWGSAQKPPRVTPSRRLVRKKSPKSSKSPGRSSEKKKNKYRQFMEHAKLLQDKKLIKESEWQPRLKALKDVRRLVGDGLLELKSWPEYVEPVFKKVFAIQLEDLRTAIIRECCGIIMEVCDILREDAVDIVRFFLPHLFKLLYVSIKVVSISAHACLHHMVSCIPSLDLLEELIIGTKDSHASVRRRSIEYLQVLIIARCEDEGIEDFQEEFASPLLSCLGDGDPEVRSSSRALFFELQRIWPRYAVSLISKMPPEVQRAIKREEIAALKKKGRSRIRKAQSSLTLGGSRNSPRKSPPVSIVEPKGRPGSRRYNTMSPRTMATVAEVFDSGYSSSVRSFGSLDGIGEE
ncbi:hypothetical protein AAMO2058_001705900 [Amorphochlora amoebiformis]